MLQLQEAGCHVGVALRRGCSSKEDGLAQVGVKACLTCDKFTQITTARGDGRGAAPGFIREVAVSKYLSNCSVSLVTVAWSPNLTAMVKAKDARYLRKSHKSKLSALFADAWRTESREVV
jgi:hypothetical protein